MENYEKLYKEALERAKDCCVNKKFSELEDTAQQLCEYVFPELRESEDERIRKKLINFFSKGAEHDSSTNGIKDRNIIAWLEKQGEYKIDSKLKVGDWIINNDKRIAVPTQILKIEKYGYLHSMGYTSFDKVKTEYHLWTIQDAKDGDVLYENDTKTILIFKSQICGRIKVYCDYWISKDKYTGSDNNNCGRLSEMKLMPATKEQCDLLFQKMKEVGYEWDAEKKELRAIEQSCYHNDGLYYAIDILEKTLGKVEGYQSDDGKVEHQIAIETVNALYHKKPAEWSEEDEENRINAIKYLEIFDAQAIHGDVAIPCINWLKSLKFKPNHWKPSEEQMAALVIAVHDANGRCHYEKLFSIYNDLKKL